MGLGHQTLLFHVQSSVCDSNPRYSALAVFGIVTQHLSSHLWRRPATISGIAPIYRGFSTGFMGKYPLRQMSKGEFSVSVNSKGHYEVTAIIEGNSHRRFVRPNRLLYRDLKQQDISDLSPEEKIRLTETLFLPRF